MKFSNYQHILFDIKDSCNVCDKLIIPNEPFIFHGKGDILTQLSDEIDTNPSNFLNPLDTTININFATNPVITDYSSIILYYGDKMYLYYFDETIVSPPSGEINTVGNITYVKVYSDVNTNTTVNSLENFINATIGVDSGGAVVAGSLGADIYISGFDYFLIANLNIVSPLTYGAQRFGLNNMYYENGNICFFNISNLLGISTTTPSFFDNFTATAGNYFKANVKGVNSLPFPLNYTIEFLDGSFLPIDTITGTINANEPFEIKEEKYIVANTFFISVVFSNPLLASEITGFCVDSFEFTEYDVLANVTVKDCNGAILAVPQVITNASEIQQTNLDLTNFVNCCLIVEATDSQNIVHTSNMFEVINYDALPNCNKTKLKINWLDTCIIDGVDYVNMAFTNEIYVNGYAKKITGGSTLNTVTTASGIIKSIGSLTYPKKQVFIVGYGDAFQYLFERIFIHKLVYINDEQVTITDNYEIADLGLKRYIGRVEVNEIGKRLLTKSCCC